MKNKIERITNLDLRIGKRFLLILSFIVSFCAARGQQILFRNYDVQNGLSSNTVWNVLQDDQGFIWLGTKNGLNRFDGYDFKLYSIKQNKEYAGNSQIHSLCKIDSVTFWVGTSEGLFAFDLRTEQFKRISFTKADLIFDLLKSADGTIWIATKSTGLFRFNPRTKQAINYRASKGGLSSNQIRKIVEDEQGRIWLGTFGEGVCILDPGSNKFEYHKASGLPGSLSGNFILTMHKGQHGVVWVGTLAAGLNKWEPGSGSYKVYQKNGEGTISDNIVRAVYESPSGKTYIATEKGLNILDAGTGAFSKYTNNKADPYSISDNAVYSIYADREGGIWVGTFFGGINYFSPRDGQFEFYYPNGLPGALAGNAVSCFLEDKPGYFWVGTENGGLNYYDASTNKFQQYPFAKYTNALSYNNIHALLKDDKEQLWVGTYSGGLNVINLSNGSLKKYEHDAANLASISNNSIYSIYKDRSNTIWVGTVKGLNVFNPATDGFTEVDNTDLQNSCIYKIHEDEARNFWVATYENGLFKKAPDNNQWENFRTESNKPSLSSNRLIALYDDRKGNLWLGTDGGGLNKLNKETGAVEVFNTSSGISSVVFGILEDKEGLLWLSTNNGILRFSPATKKVLSYSSLNNLQGRLYNYNAYYKSSDGKFFFGGINGFNAFYPDKITTSPTVNNIVLTNFKVFDQEPDLSDSDSPLKKLIGFSSIVTLAAKQSVISFEYALVDYTDPDKIQYAYKMNGFDDQWNHVGTQRIATYTNLPPGTYTFNVKATDVYGNWSDKVASIKVRVNPPFYRTTFAYIVYLLLLIGGVFALRNYFKQREIKRNAIRLEKLKTQREKEFYQQKIDFFTTMAHEIRTPLSLIMAPLENLIDAVDDKHQLKQLNVMEENSKRLQLLVNQLLDFRRIESDIYTIRKEPMDLVAFIHAVYSRFGTMAAQKNVRFLLTTNVDRLLLNADPEALQKIINNLLINAFKFADTKVALKISVQDSNGTGKAVTITISDDGIGIPEAELAAVFKPFYKVINEAHQSKNIGGTGIGLSLAKALAEKHGGALVAKNSEADTTSFILTLPFEEEVAQRIFKGADEEMIEEKDEPHRTTILIVEDDLNMMDFISTNLQAEGYTTCCAINGNEALAILPTRQIDLVLSDVMMPEMDGTKLCRRIKGDINSSHIPVVLLTAKGTSDAELEGLESGADAYIMKPFKWKQIIATLKNILETRSLLKEKFSTHPFTAVDTLPTNQSDRELIDKITAIVEARLDDYQLSVEELSKELAMSRSTLHKKMKAISGQGPNEFIRILRLKEAARLLLSGGCNVSEAGYRTGFNSPSYFTKCFTQQFNVTPSEFVEKYLSDNEYKKSVVSDDKN